MAVEMWAPSPVADTLARWQGRAAEAGRKAAWVTFVDGDGHELRVSAQAVQSATRMTEALCSLLFESGKRVVVRGQLSEVLSALQDTRFWAGQSAAYESAAVELRALVELLSRPPRPTANDAEDE